MARLTSHDYLVVEGHIDIFELTERIRRGEKTPLKDEMLPRFTGGGIDVIILPVGGDGVHHRDGSERPLVGSLDVLDLFIRQVEACGAGARIALAKEDLPSESEPEAVSFVMELEGGRPFQEDYSSGKDPERRLALLRCFFRLGVRSVQLTHNGRNELGDSMKERDGGAGLSQFGAAAIEEMNRLGILVGVSHLSDAGFFDALEISTQPIVATHSNARAVFDHPRNLSDRQLKALAENGGMVGMHFLGMMMAEPTMDHFLNHLDHVVQVTGSAEHVGIGIHGFDPLFNRLMPHGGGSIIPGTGEGLSNEAHLSLMIESLLNRGYGEGDVSRVMGGNYIRVLRQVLPARKGN
jgi:membrane dipeptidase